MPQFFYWTHRRKDGVLLDVEVSLKAIRVSGRIVLLNIVRDITERKRAEEALRESEMRYHMLTEASPVGIFHTDAAGRFLYVNERWCQIIGFIRDEALEKGMS